MKATLPLLCMLFLCLSLSAQTEEEFDALSDEAFEALDRYDFRMAIDLEHVLLEWNQRPHLRNDTNDVIILVNLGGFYQNYQRFDSARYFLELAQKTCIKTLGKGETYVNVLLILGGLYEQLELLREAEILNAEAIELVEKKKVTEDPVLIAYLYNNQAIVKKKLFKLREAHDLILLCEQYTLQYAGEQDLDFAATLNTKAMILGDMGERKREEDLLLQAKKICEKLKATDRSLYGTILNNLAVMYSERGEYKLALTTYQRAAGIAASIYSDNSLQYALYLANWGISLGDAGDYNQGILKIQKSKRIILELLGPFHPDWFERAAVLGTLYESAGMFREADLLYEELLESGSRELGTDNPAYLTVLSNAALYYKNTEQFDKANTCYTTLLEHSDAMDEWSAITVKGNYTDFLHQIGREDEAAKGYDEVLQAWEKHSGRESLDYLTARHNRAVFLLDMGKLEPARKELEETEKILKRMSGSKTPLILSLMENLAGLYMDDGKVREALDRFAQLHEIQVEEYGGQSMTAADLKSKISLCYTRLDQVDQGLQWMEDAYTLKVKLSGKDNPALSYELTLLATTYTYRNEYKKGIEYYNESVRLIADQFSRYFRFMTESEKLRFLNQKMSELKQLQALAFDNAVEYEGFGTLALDVELIMKGMVLESAGRMKQLVTASNDAKLQADYTELLNLKTQLGRELSKNAEYRRSDYKDLVKRSEQLEKGIIAKLGLGDGLDVKKQSWKTVQQKLSEGEALVEFVNYNTFWNEEVSIAAIVLKPGLQSPVLVPLYSEEAMKAYLSSLGKGSDQSLVNVLYGETRGAGAIPDEQTPLPGEDSLYHYIWKPLESALRGVSRVYYSPAGSVNKVSIAALRDEEGKYLSDKYELFTLSSGRVLLQTASDFKLKEVLLLGGVNYDLTPDAIAKKEKPETDQPQMALRGGNGSQPWKYLDGTLSEVDQISALLKKKQVKVNLLSGDEAYEEQTGRSMSGGADIIHLSTHGFFFPEQKAGMNSGNPFQVSDNPLLRSGLILTGANAAWTGAAIPEGLSDGILTAYEVSAMDLSRTRLAVLSACQTGLGDIQGSEGVFGLQRAFKLAGVEYIVMSLWQVPDKETVEFMSEFYRNLSEGMGIPQSFNAAQKVMRGKYPPYYWAAFVLVK